MSKKFDTAIIFGGSLNNDATLKNFVKKRADMAIDLYDKGEVGSIIASGSLSFFVGTDHQISEAEAIAKYLIDKGVKKESILLEKKSRDTIGNIYFSKEIIEARNWKKIICITSYYHLERTEFLFNKIVGKHCVFKFFATDNCQVDVGTLRREGRLIKIMKIIFYPIPAGSSSVFRIFLKIEYSLVPLFADFLKKYLSA